jgi:thiol-disulfide isomerase/thioredoxin
VRRLSAAAAVLVAAASVVLAGCGGDPVTKQYVFHQDTAKIKVDTPELRHLKASAAIEPCPKTSAPATAKARGLPDLTLPCLGGGRAVNLAELRGPLVLNLWAQWCTPCRDETKVFAHVADEYRGKLQVIGVDWQDTKPDWALEMLRYNRATYPQLADPDAATRAPLSIRGMPTTFFIAADGSVAYVNNGPFTTAEELQGAIETHLGVTLAGAGT